MPEFVFNPHHSIFASTHKLLMENSLRNSSTAMVGWCGITGLGFDRFLLSPDFSPHCALLRPVYFGRDRPQPFLMNGGPPRGNTRQKQQLFLDVRSQVIEIHDLRDPWLCDMCQASQFRKVGDFALLNLLIEADGQCHQLGHQWQLWFSRDGGGRWLIGELPTSLASTLERNRLGDRNHAALSWEPVASDLIPAG